jgi:hypothetical protein
MDEVVEIRVFGEGAAKIVNDEAKSDVFRFVAEQAWCVGTLNVAEATQVSDEPLLAGSARLWQAVHEADRENNRENSRGAGTDRGREAGFCYVRCGYTRSGTRESGCRGKSQRYLWYAISCARRRTVE